MEYYALKDSYFVEVRETLIKIIKLSPSNRFTNTTDMLFQLLKYNKNFAKLNICAG